MTTSADDDATLLRLLAPLPPGASAPTRLLHRTVTEGMRVFEDEMRDDLSTIAREADARATTAAAAAATAPATTAGSFGACIAGASIVVVDVDDDDDDDDDEVASIESPGGSQPQEPAAKRARVENGGDAAAPPAVASGEAVVDDDEIISGDADDDDDAEEEIAPIEEYVRTQLCEAVMRGKALAARSSRPTFVDLPAEDELSFEYNHPFEAYLRRIDPEHDVHAELARFRDEHAALLDSYSAEHERFATLRPLFEHAATVELVGRRAARTSSGARRLVARYRITYASRLLSPRLLEFDDDDEATTTLGYLEAVLALVSFDARARAHAWQCLPANVRSRLGKTVLATVFAAIDGNRRRRYEHLVGMYDDWCDVIEGAADSCADV
jgi:hypothetical protein